MQYFPGAGEPGAPEQWVTPMRDAIHEIETVILLGNPAFCPMPLTYAAGKVCDRVQEGLRVRGRTGTEVL
jgi:hypothetical protein